MEPSNDSEIAQRGFRAVEEGDVNRLRWLTNKKQKSAYPKEWEDGMALLRLAVTLNKTYPAQYLMREVVEINVETVLEQPSDHDKYLLTTAIFSNNVEVVECLLGAGAAVNGIDFRGWSPLGNAVNENRVEIADILLKRGADPNVANTRNETPLAIAVGQNYEKLVELLLRNGADINKADGSGNFYSPLCEVISNRHWNIVSLFLKYKPGIDSGGISKVVGLKELAEYDKMFAVFKEHQVTLAVFDRADGSQLFDAVREGNVDVVEECLARNDESMKNVNKAISPLHVAVFYKQEEVVKVLIENGADLLCEDGYGKTPVDYATKNDDLSMLETFFTTKPCFKDNLLFPAVKLGSIHFIERLLQAGANLFTQDDRGYTPLHRAVYHEDGDTECTKLLLDYGADPNILDKDGGNALCSACPQGLNFFYPDLLELLSNYGADVNTVLNDRGHTAFTLRADNFDMSDYDEISYHLTCLHYLATLKVAGLIISDRNFEFWKECNLDEDPGTQEFLASCEREVKLMKQEKIYRRFRLSDILTASENQLAKLAGDKELTKYVLGGGYSRKYPSYKDLIIAKFQLGKIRRRFLAKGSKALQYIWPDVPTIVEEIILQSLSNKDIFMLARSFCKPHIESCCCRRTVRP